MCRIGGRICANRSNATFCATGDSFDPIKIGIGERDRSGELRVLADVVLFEILKQISLHFSFFYWETMEVVIACSIYSA